MRTRVSSFLLPSLALLAAMVSTPADAACPRTDPDCNKHNRPDEPGRPPPAPTPIKVSPSFIVVGILYAPPGNASEVTYGQGSSVGSKLEITNSFKGGVQASAEVKAFGGAEVTVGYQFGGKTGNSWEVTKSQSKTISLASQIDTIDHTKDEFFVWANPELEVTTTDTTVKSTLSAKNTMVIVPLTGREVLDPSQIPAYKKAQLGNLTATDFAQMAQLDPLLTQSSIDARRFIKVDTLQVDGPDVAGDPVIGTALEVDKDATMGSISGFTQQVNVSVMAETGFELGPFGSKLKLGGTLEWDYENTTESTTGHSETASAKLSTSTVGFHDSVDVYFDSLFNSFMFASSGASSMGKKASHKSPAIVGQVTRGGAPVSGEVVTIQLGNGTKRRVLTNARGGYRLTEAPAGTAKVQFGGQERAVTIGAAPVTVIMELPAQATLKPKATPFAGRN
jgi:hypothetical protein